MGKIVVCCAGGMSSSILQKRVHEEAEQRGVEHEVVCYSLGMAKERARDADVIMLGPQVSFLRDNLQRACPGVLIQVIPMLDYGRMRADKVLDLALGVIRTGKVVEPTGRP